MENMKHQDLKTRNIVGIGTIISIAAYFGVDSEKLIEVAGLQDVNFNDHKIFITKRQVKLLWQEVLEQKNNDETIILEMAKRVPLGVHGILAQMAMASPDIRTKFSTISKFISLLDKSIDVEIIDSKETLSIRLSPKVEEFNCRFDSLFLIYLFVLRQKEMSVGDVVFPREVHLRDHYNIEYSILDDAFACPVLTRQKDNIITFNTSDLDSPNTYSNEPLYEILHNQASDLLKENLPQSPEQLVSLKVKKLIRTNILKGKVDKEYVASHLKLSPRGLQRKLSDEGTSYRELCEDVKRDLSSKLLKTTSISIDEIAHGLGYNDRPAFNRAFKKWFELTPAKYRNINSD